MVDNAVRLIIIAFMNSGATQFMDWLKRREWNQADAARYLNMEASHLSLIMHGKRTPALKTAIKLERMTGIPVEAWAIHDEKESEAVIHD